MCETRDLGIRWPQWHTLMFSDELKIDMRLVCPKDVKKMLIQRSRSVYWKQWAAKHGYEELKEGTWLVAKESEGNWTAKHRNVARKIFFEFGWTQKRLFDVGWSDISQCQACQKEKGTEKHRLYHCPEWYEVTKSDGRFQRFSESWSKKQEPQRSSGSGKEVLLNILSLEVNGTGAISV